MLFVVVQPLTTTFPLRTTSTCRSSSSSSSSFVLVVVVVAIIIGLPIDMLSLPLLLLLLMKFCRWISSKRSITDLSTTTLCDNSITFCMFECKVTCQTDQSRERETVRDIYYVWQHSKLVCVIVFFCVSDSISLPLLTTLNHIQSAKLQKLC